MTKIPRKKEDRRQITIRNLRRSTLEFLASTVRSRAAP
jgi:hypothetical protein